VDVSEEAVRARMQDLTDGAKGLTLSDDLEKTEKERMDLFYSFVKQRRDAGVLEQVSAHREVVGEAEHLEIKSKAPLVLAELLFDDKIHLQVRKRPRAATLSQPGVTFVVYIRLIRSLGLMGKNNYREMGNDGVAGMNVTLRIYSPVYSTHFFVSFGPINPDAYCIRVLTIQG